MPDDIDSGEMYDKAKEATEQSHEEEKSAAEKLGEESE